ncbi:hypothetical protein B0H34DRAFT_858530 [Crassisporium funariophilum]|nr:hypothetical protein B0H34DRAFT_858530 [Crassisporium funariophilum]
MPGLAAQTPGSFMGPQGKRIAGMVAGASVLAYLFTRKKEDKPDRRPSAVHRGEYSTTDAVAANHRAAKNADVKGNQPSASKWA